MDGSFETSSPKPATGTTARPVVLGVDISETEGKITGVGRYTLDLLEIWLDQASALTPPPVELVLFARHRERVPGTLRDRAELITTRNSSSGDIGVVRWQQLHLPGLLRRRPVDLIFCPAYAVPLLSRTPSVVALHDLSFERDPRAFSRKEGWRRRLLARASARKAKGIVTISEFSKGEIETLYGVSAEKILMAYPGCNREVFHRLEGRTEESTEAQSRLQPASQSPFLLAVGTLLERRNIDVLIQAFAALGPEFKNHHLVIVGGNQTRRPTVDFAALAAAAGVHERVRFETHVSETRLVQLYRTTELFVSLSRYEGFGLPVLEALCCGAPALLLDSAVNRELWTGVVPMVTEAEAQPVARAIETAAGRPPNHQTVDGFAGNRFNQALEAAKVLKFLCTLALS